VETRDRAIDAAMVSFGDRGYDATSLDMLATDLGIRKQSVLYHFGSKEGLLEAVIDSAADELAATIEIALDSSDEGWSRIETVVKTVFTLAVRRPERLAVLREVSRLGSPWTTRAMDRMKPLVDRADSFLRTEMKAGRMRQSDPRLLLVSVYSTVMGVATEVEVLRAVGIEPTLREAVMRRRELLAFLHSALVID
jgi:TetR/AcrR family transcriptional regulator